MKARCHLYHRNGDPLDDRAERRCRCGGVQYDWGAGPGSHGWAMNWFCVGRGGCGRMSVEHMSYERLLRLRQKTKGAGRRRSHVQEAA